MVASKVTRNKKSGNGVKGIVERLEKFKNLSLGLPQQKVFFIRAPIFRRILAFIVDIFIFDFLISPLKKVFNFNSSFGLTGSYVSLFSLGIVISFLFFLYNFLLQYKLGQTLGMMLLQIRLINSGEILDAVKLKNKSVVNAFPSFYQVFFRNIIFIPVFPLVLVWIIDPIYLFVKKERFTDKLIRVGVVQEVFA